MAVLGALYPARTSAQEEMTPSTAALPVSPPLSADHWAVRAAARAEALGLVERYLPAQRSAPRAAVGAALLEAATRAPEEAPEVAALASAWLARFAEEFPESAFERAGGVQLLGSTAWAGYEGRSGVAAPGSQMFQFRQGITVLPDRSTPEGGAELAVALTRHLSAVVEPHATRYEAELARWEVAAGTGPWALSVGREPVGYGPAASGGVVFTGGVALPRVELQTTRPVVFPGVLRHLGPVSFHTFATRLYEPRHRGDPYLWGARGALRLHPRFTVGVSRGSIFGGDSVPTPVSLKSLASMLVGILSDDFENQIVSMDFRYRVPSEAVLPLTLYLEWGADDGAGAWWDVPGRVMGAQVPALPGLPQVVAGAEYTTFGALCCGNPGWYLHANQPGGWAARDVALGHPLGGEGSELLVYASADLLRARVRVDARGFRRDRGVEGYHTYNRAGNVFAPERAGESFGAAADVAWRATPRSEVRVTASREAGEGWSAGELRAFVSMLF